MFSSLFKRSPGASAPPNSTNPPAEISRSSVRERKLESNKRKRQETTNHVADDRASSKKQRVNHSFSQRNNNAVKRGGGPRNSSSPSPRGQSANAEPRKTRRNKNPSANTARAPPQQRKSAKRKVPLEEALEFSAKLKDLSTKKRLRDALALYWDPLNKDIRDGHHASIMVDCCSRCGAVELSVFHDVTGSSN